MVFILGVIPFSSGFRIVGLQVSFVNTKLAKKSRLFRRRLSLLNVEIHHIFLLSREFSLLIFKETFQSFFENIFIDSSHTTFSLLTLVS